MSVGRTKNEMRKDFADVWARLLSDYSEFINLVKSKVLTECLVILNENRWRDFDFIIENLKYLKI